jgi:hypothetical protein
MEEESGKIHKVFISPRSLLDGDSLLECRCEGGDNTRLVPKLILHMAHFVVSRLPESLDV